MGPKGECKEPVLADVKDKDFSAITNAADIEKNLSNLIYL